MAFVYGCSSSGKKTLIYKNFEYVRECVNKCGTVSWRCRFFQKYKCKAPIVTADDRVAEDKQPDHTHGVTFSNN
jgi:hypothetical protein